MLGDIKDIIVKTMLSV
jgi:tubulin polyglutamylase TTLL6/13